MSAVSISSKTGEDFVQISAQAGDPQQQAAAIANAFAQQFVNSLNVTTSRVCEGLLKLSQQQLSQTPGGAASDAQRANLLAQINRLQLDVRFPTNPAQQINPALPPSSPSSPKPVRNALFALILSLVGAIALAYGFDDSTGGCATRRSWRRRTQVRCSPCCRTVTIRFPSPTGRRR